MRRAIQKGFTLIELVVVIVILGILAAIAVPQFVDLSANARTAVGQATCGAIQSTSLVLFASASGVRPTFAAITAGTSFTAPVTSISGTCAAPVVNLSGAPTTVTCSAIVYCN